MQNNNNNIKKRNSIISKQQHIIEEFSENGEIQYNCTVCRKTFRSRSQKYYHLNCNQSQNLLYQCEHCDKSFVRKSQWKYHNESHLSPINECKKCQKTFSNPLALKKHLLLHKVEPKFCPHCNKCFKKKVSLEQHIAAQHLNQLQYGCAFCNKKYASKSTLQLHLQSHDKKRFECTFCGKQFQRNSILKLHFKRHYNTNVICNICQKVFSESGALARHRKIHEEKIVQYRCKLCDKNILRKDNMTRHLNTIHPDKKFNNIVEIIKPEMANTNVNPNNIIKKNLSHDIKTSKEEYKNVVIIENKLLQKPFELKECITEPTKNTINKLTTNYCTEYPIANQIKVITANCTNVKKINYESNENVSHSFLQPSITINYHQVVDSKILEQSETSLQNSATEPNCDENLIQSKFVAQLQKDVADISLKIHSSTYLNKSQNQTEEQTIIQNFSDNHNPPKTQTISSVIRSVGNVKNLTCHFDAPSEIINQTCSEYKHKKYCRNNYNIDLYRKILGCDDDEDNENKQKEQQSQEDLCANHLMKSSTAAAVHWRKSFKNNYETWST